MRQEKKKGSYSNVCFALFFDSTATCTDRNDGFYMYRFLSGGRCSAFPSSASFRGEIRENYML